MLPFKNHLWSDGSPQTNTWSSDCSISGTAFATVSHSSSTNFGANSASQENGRTSNTPLFNGNRELLFNVLQQSVCKSFNKVGYCFSLPLENQGLQPILNYVLKFTHFKGCPAPPGKIIPVKYTSDEIFSSACLNFPWELYDFCRCSWLGKKIKMTQPAHFRFIQSVSCLVDPTAPQRRRGEPRVCLIQPVMPVRLFFNMWVDVGQGWNLFSQSKFPLPFVYLCHFLIFEMCGFCLCSPKRQMLRYCSGNSLLAGGWDGIKLSKGWNTWIFLLTGPLPPATSLCSKKLQICALSQSFELPTCSALW